MRRIAVSASLCLAAASALTLASCASGPLSADADLKGMVYNTAGGVDLMMDACLAPPTDGGTPALLLIHGGGFQEGGRESSGMPQLCERMAAAGYSAFPIDYRLLPDDSFPAQIEDAQAAVSWLREPAQVERFGIDPSRIGAVGSSAGAIIAQSLGTIGEGSLDSGSRVKVVVSMSGASDFTENGQSLGDPGEEVEELILAYLGCTEVAGCPTSQAASPIFSVTEDDSATILFNSDDEIVPLEQAEAMNEALRRAGVITELVVSAGSKHAISAMGPTNTQRMERFLLANL